MLESEIKRLEETAKRIERVEICYWLTILTLLCFAAAIFLSL